MEGVFLFLFVASRRPLASALFALSLRVLPVSQITWQGPAFRFHIVHWYGIVA
jgi:hypothetical protein